jgi:GT2 family glycosyltransferase
VTDNAPTISVVLPTYNRVEDLRRCLTALESQTPGAGPFDVIVIDDGSTDGTLLLLKEMQAHSRLRLRFMSQANRGPAAARNRGIGESSSPLIAFTDDDCIPEPDWLERLLAALPADARCAGIGGRVMRQNDSRIGRFIDLIGTLNPPLSEGKALYLVTANALYRRSCLLEVKGFDEQFAWPGGEDQDISDRLRDRGYYHAFTDTAVIHHKHRDTLSGLFRTHRHYGRGDRIRARIGRKPGLFFQSVPLFLIGCVGHWGLSCVRYLLHKDLPVLDRFCFCFYRLVCNVGVAIGFADSSFRARGIARARNDESSARV